MHVDQVLITFEFSRAHAGVHFHFHFMIASCDFATVTVHGLLQPWHACNSNHRGMATCAPRPLATRHWQLFSSPYNPFRHYLYGIFLIKRIIPPDTHK